MKKRKKRITAAVFVILLAALAAAVLFLFGGRSKDSKVRREILADSYELKNEASVSYEEYLAQHGDAYALHIDNKISLSGRDYSECDMEELTDAGNYIITGDSGFVTWNFNIPQEGLYNIEVTYCPIADSTLSIVRAFYINGEIPFDDAKNIIFERIWTDDSKDFLMQTDGNQAGPTEIQKEEWVTKKIDDSDHCSTGAYAFYFKKGSNTITLKSNQARLGIKDISLIPARDIPSYEKYFADLTSSGISVIPETDMEEGAIMIQAEDAFAKTSSVLIPLNDRTSPKSIPYHHTYVVYNTIGGESWSIPGDSITWQVKVPKEGLYKIALRFRQYMNRDFFSIRELRINDEVPFKEAANLTFNYDSDFQLAYLGGDNQDYYFHLKEGENTLTLTVTLGHLYEAVEMTKTAVKNLNALYRNIVSVTGTNPDRFRDYNILASVPDMTDILKTEYARIDRIIAMFNESTRGGTKTSTLARMLAVMEKIIDKPDDIAKYLTDFNDKLSGLSEWMLNLGFQPLELDYIMICGDGYKLPKAEGNFFENALHAIKAFFGSFTNDYKVKSDKASTGERTVKVWICTTVRSQFEIVQRMIMNRFKNSGINVQLSMVQADTIMPAVVTGNGPDVVIQVDYAMPANFAYRNAAYDLSQFEDFEQVASEFPKGAMEYLEYEGGYYGLPDQMTFPVIFYRKDILDDLGLEVPDTWDELKAMIPYLEAANMSLYLSTGVSDILGGTSSFTTSKVNFTFLSLLYQKGEELYRDKGRDSNLDSRQALLTFKDWTEYYTKHGLNRSISVVTRFRTGEVPILVEDYTYRNSIMASAPEIDGYWGIAPIPGTLREDGTIDRSTPCLIGSSMMIKDSVEKHKNADDSWIFLKWWVSADTQASFANELKALLGSAAEYPVANVNAIEKLSMDAETRDVIKTSAGRLRGVPQVPGGYITGRIVQNAFISAITENLEPVDTLYMQINDINIELANKRREFGLSD